MNNTDTKEKTIKCPECGQKDETHWEMRYGMRLVHEVKGKQFYSAFCPRCKNIWDVPKR